MLLPEPVLRHDGPVTLLASVNKQEVQNRFVVHLLHYIPERVSQTIDVIEDIIPLYNVKVSVKIPAGVKKAELVPEAKELNFNIVEGRVEFTVPEITGHQMIAIELA
jgi:hypothetical protein